MAAVHRARRGRDRHGWRVGVGRVRRAHECRRDGSRPDGSRGRIRDVERVHGDAQGDMGVVSAARARSPRAHRQQRGRLRDGCGCDVLRRVRGHGRGTRAAAGGRDPHRCDRLGRCHECVRRGHGGTGAPGRVEHRAQAGRRRAGTSRTRTTTSPMWSSTGRPSRSRSPRRRCRVGPRTRRPRRRRRPSRRPSRRRPRHRRPRPRHAVPRRAPHQSRRRSPLRHPTPSPVPTPHRHPTPAPTPTPVPTPSPTPTRPPTPSPQPDTDAVSDSDPTRVRRRSPHRRRLRPRHRVRRRSPRRCRRRP